MSSPSRHGPTWQVCNAVGSGKGDKVAATMRRGDRLMAMRRRTVIDENKSKKEWIIMRCESHSSCHLSVSSKEIMRKIATPTVQEVRCRLFDDSICTEHSSYRLLKYTSNKKSLEKIGTPNPVLVKINKQCTTFCRYYNFNLLRVQIFSGFLLIGIYFSRLGYIAYLKNPFSLAAAAAPRSLQAYDNYGGARRRRQAPNGE